MTPTARHLTLSAAALLGTLATLAAQAIELPAGKWGMNSETVSPSAAEPMKDYSEECFIENFNPATAVTESGLGDQCLFTPTTDTAAEFAADLVCDMGDAGTASGNMRIKLNGAEASGELKLGLDAGHMLLSNKWTGKRLGACE
jgi:hypothetical protein